MVEPTDDSDDSDADAAHDVLLHAVERFAVLLAEAGMPRMAARIFAYLLIDERDAATAGFLSERLRVSPAAISGALRYLVQAGLLVRDRRPGVRSDEYRLHGDIWYETYLQRSLMMRRWEETLAETIELLGPDHAGPSLRETRAFLAFLRDEYPALMERWKSHRQTLDLD